MILSSLHSSTRLYHTGLFGLWVTETMLDALGNMHDPVEENRAQGETVITVQSLNF
jgi:hypothetical protein